MTVTLLDPEDPAAIDNDAGVVHVKPEGHTLFANEKVLELQAAESVFVTVTVYDNAVPAVALWLLGVTETVGGLRAHAKVTT